MGAAGWTSSSFSSCPSSTWIAVFKVGTSSGAGIPSIVDTSLDCPFRRINQRVNRPSFSDHRFDMYLLAFKNATVDCLI
jgi:hypothetical protein